MAIHFTDKQQRVLEACGHNVLVSAAAGSGKTAVLVERILRMISEGDHPLDIDRLLVVTFTRAAAAQMRERIGRAISQRLAEHPDDRHLQRQEILLHRAQITTIDSFCAGLLRGNPGEIDLDPGFRQMDETQAKLLEGDVLRRYLEEQYAAALDPGDKAGASRAAGTESAQPGAEGDGGGSGPAGEPERTVTAAGTRPGRSISPERFYACVDYFCPGRNDEELGDLILKLHRAADSHPYPEVWLEARREDYAAQNTQALQACGWYRGLILDCLETARSLRGLYRAMLRIVREPDGPYPWRELFEYEGERLFGWMDELPDGDLSGPDSISDMEGVRRHLADMSRFSFTSLNKVRIGKADKELIDPDKKQRAQDLRNEIKERVKKFAEGIDEAPEITLERMRAASGPLNTLIDLALGFREALTAQKKEKNVADFSDLEHYALQILIDRAPDGTLTPSRTAAACRACYDEVLIDEYQDSNEVQELLLSAVTGEAEAGLSLEHSRYARFMVGDVKQSIYRFRNARPEIFQKKFDTYAAGSAGDSARGGAAAGNTSAESGAGRQAASCAGDFPDCGGGAPASAAAGSSAAEKKETKPAFSAPEKERIDLDQNFRSRTEVLDAANGVCEKIMRREIGGVEYDGTVSLKPGASYPEPVPDADGSDPYQTELLVVDCAPPEGGAGEGAQGDAAGRPKSEGSAKSAEAGGTHWRASADAAQEEEDGREDEIAALSAGRKEALAVAGRIRQMVGILPVQDEETGRQRPARYGDIAILLRSSSGRQEAWREIFEKEGIPLYLEYKGGYFSAEEIRAILQVLRVIDNPRQDIPLYGTLRGYFGGFTPDEIGQIRAQGSRLLAARDEEGAQESPGREILLYDCLLAAAGEEKKSGAEAPSCADSSGNGEGRTPDGPDGECAAAGREEGTISPALRRRCADFLAWLWDLRARSAAMPVRELIGDLVRTTGYEDYVRALPSGARRAANLHSLLVMAARFEEADQAGLYRFLRSIDRMHELDVDYGEANVLDEHADVVRLTTIHKSKGLEYPICFVCGLGSRHTYVRDLSGTLLTDADLGLGIRYVDPKLRCSVSTLRQKAVAARIERDALGEELRVLYVAMTRAKEKLILSGAFPDAAKKLQSIEDDMDSVELPARHLPQTMILSRDGFLPLILKAVYALKAEGREPIRVSTVRVTDLQLAQLEDQMTLGALERALEDMEHREPPQLPKPELAGELERHFSFRYPHEELTGLYTKTTVTELKRAALADADAQEEGGAVPYELYPEKGTAERWDAVPGEETAGIRGEDPKKETAGIRPADRGKVPPEVRDADQKKENLTVRPADQGKVPPEVRDAVRGADGEGASLRDTLPVPRFAQELPESEGAGRLTGAARGTAVHRILELIDYREWPEPGKVTAAQFQEKFRRLLSAGEIPPAYESIAKPYLFLPFLHSDIASRMAAADAAGRLFREQPFVLGISSSRMNRVFPSEETILIQGIIDAYFLEEDMVPGRLPEAAAAGTDGPGDMNTSGSTARSPGAGGETGEKDPDGSDRKGPAARSGGRHIVLVDYKTDRVRAAQELKDRYRVQLDYYAEALEKMLRLPVTERIIYSFQLNCEIRV